MAPMPLDKATRTSTAEVRGLLMAAALRVLDERGESGVTVRTVATAAQVAPMGVYNHFGDKAGLMSALVSDGFTQIRDMVAANVDADSRVRLTRAGLAYRAFALRSPTLYTLMYSGRYQPDSMSGHTALGALTEIIRYGQAAGTIRTTDPSDLALQVWACVHGAVSLELHAAGPSDVNPDWENVYHQTLDLISHGIAPRS